jgi:hypothetical protein
LLLFSLFRSLFGFSSLRHVRFDPSRLQLWSLLLSLLPFSSPALIPLLFFFFSSSSSVYSSSTPRFAPFDLSRQRVVTYLNSTVVESEPVGISAAAFPSSSSYVPIDLGNPLLLFSCFFSPFLSLWVGLIRLLCRCFFQLSPSASLVCLTTAFTSPTRAGSHSPLLPRLLLLPLYSPASPFSLWCKALPLLSVSTAPTPSARPLLRPPSELPR